MNVLEEELRWGLYIPVEVHVARLRKALEDCGSACSPRVRAEGYVVIGLFYAGFGQPTLSRAPFAEAIRLAPDIVLDTGQAAPSAFAEFAAACDEVLPKSPAEKEAEAEALASVESILSRYAASKGFDAATELEGVVARCANRCRPTVTGQVRSALDDVRATSWEQMASIEDIKVSSLPEAPVKRRRAALDAVTARCDETRCERWVPSRAWLSLGVLHAMERRDYASARRAFEQGLTLCPDATLGDLKVDPRTQELFDPTLKISPGQKAIKHQ